jgi:hypothetical protein
MKKRCPVGTIRIPSITAPAAENSTILRSNSKA